MHRALPLLAALAACGHSSPSAPVVVPVPPAHSTSIALPGAPPGGVMLDYLAYDPAHHRVWVPAGGTGKVDIIDATTHGLTSIDGFPTKEMERRGQKRLVGPSSATIGEGVVYVGNRGDSSICAFDSGTLAKQGCVTLDSMPDGLQYVASTHEVWVTTPRDKSIRILDVTTPGAPVAKDTLHFDGEPEGFAMLRQIAAFALDKPGNIQAGAGGTIDQLRIGDDLERRRGAKRRGHRDGQVLTDIEQVGINQRVG